MDMIGHALSLLSMYPLALNPCEPEPYAAHPSCGLVVTKDISTLGLPPMTSPRTCAKSD